MNYQFVQLTAKKISNNCREIMQGRYLFEISAIELCEEPGWILTKAHEFLCFWTHCKINHQINAAVGFDQTSTLPDTGEGGGVLPGRAFRPGILFTEVVVKTSVRPR
jgi:hypothetical protein